MFDKKDEIFDEFNVTREYENYKLIYEKNNDLITYDLWEKHILLHLNKKDTISNKNLKHYLINKKNKTECSLKERGSISVPAFIGFITLYMTYITTLITINLATGKRAEANYNILGFNLYIITTVMAVVFFIAMYMYQPHKMKKLLNKITFYNDIINIIDNYKAEKS